MAETLRGGAKAVMHDNNNYCDCVSRNSIARYSYNYMTIAVMDIPALILIELDTIASLPVR